MNAKSFESQGFSLIIDEDYLTENLLVEKVHELYSTRQTYIDAMSKSNQLNSINTITDLLEETLK